MVAALGLLDHLEILVERGLVLERRAVDALELRVALIAFVIGAGHAGELERAMLPVRITCGPAHRSINRRSGNR